MTASSTCGAIPSAPRRRVSTRIGFTCGLLFLLVASVTICRGHREGNSYVTFGTLWASGKATSNGLNPYAAYPETYRGYNYTNTGIDGTFPDLNLNPPWILPFIQGLAHFSLAWFMRIWVVLTAGCYLIGLLILISRNPELQGRQVIWFVLAAPTLATLSAGQVYGWVFLFGVLAWFCYERGEIISTGVLVGIIVAVRPTMGFWLLLLLLGRYRRIAIVSAATILVLYAAPLAIYGPGIYVEWLRALAGDRHWLNPYNIAVMPMFSRLGHPHVGTAIAVLTALIVCGWAVRYKPDFTATSGAALCIGILCAPLAWFHYLLFVAPFLMARRWSTLSMIGACLFLASIIDISDAVRGMMYLLGVLIILISFIAPERSHRFEAPQTPST